MIYNFDEVVDREGTESVKLDLLPEGVPENALSLWVADMDFRCAKPVIDALHKRVDRGIFGYTHADGMRYKAAVTGWFRKRFGWDVKEDCVFFSPGIVPAIALLVNCLTEQGDGIILQKPVYYPFMAKIENNGRKVSNNALIYENGTYRMDYEDLEQKLADPLNKGLLLCSPHNPVGRVWSIGELKKAAELCRKYGKWIISDEIHADLTRVGVEHIPLPKACPEYKDQMVICTAPSKTFNLAGLHGSNIIIESPEIREKWLSVADGRFSVANCSPFALEATIAAYEEGEEWLEQLKAYLDGNIRYIHEFIKENLPKAVVSKTEGTYLVWIDLNAYCSDHKQLETWMLKKAGVVLDEGYIFGEEGKGFERINAASPRSVVEECMNRLKGALPYLQEK